MASFSIIFLLCFSIFSHVLAQRDGTSRGSVFTGCYTSRPTNSTTNPIHVAPDAASFTECMSNCAAYDSTGAFGYWNSGNSSCSCTNLVHAPNTTPFPMVAANAPDCTGTRWTMGRSSTTFTQYGSASPCRTLSEMGLADSAFTAIGGPRSCHKSCAGSKYAYLYMDTTNGFRCSCSNTARGGTTSTTTCGPNTIFVFEHSAPAQASTLDRKKKREVAEAKKRAIPLFCPKGLTACGMSENAEDYECLDPQNELESCGGCVFPGPTDPRQTAQNVTLGVDCSIGAAIGAATCIRGRCQVSACRKGWTLHDGICVKGLPHSRHWQKVASA